MRTFLIVVFSLVTLTAKPAFCENLRTNQPKSWFRVWYDKLTTPTVRPVPISDPISGPQPQPVRGKSIVVYYGNHPEVVSLTATNYAGSWIAPVQTK